MDQKDVRPASNGQTAGSRAFYRPDGFASAGELAYRLADALTEACDAGFRDAVVNIAAMRGFESPGPAFRRWAVGMWAEKVRGRIRVAMVARQEHLCPHKTGLIIAAEEGLDANVFLTEAEAVAWLDGRPGDPGHDVLPAGPGRDESHGPV